VPDVEAGPEPDLDHVAEQIRAGARPKQVHLGCVEEPVRHPGDDVVTPPAHRHLDFSAGTAGTALTEDDLSATKLGEDVLDWHKVLLQLRDHYADPTANPRERFSVVVTQDEATGTASGIGITSARQPLVDDLTVRQTGGIAFTLSRLVNDRIAAEQEMVFAELKDSPKEVLDKLVRLEIAGPEERP